MPSNGTRMPVQKPEETLDKHFDQPRFVLIDLGIAQLFRPGDFRRQGRAGTPCTMAPEVWSGSVTPKADVWSCGCVFFEILALQLPFRVPPDRADGYAFWKSKPTPDWNLLETASPAAQQLCQLMLQIDRRARPTAAKCLKQQFFQDEAEGQEDVSGSGSGPEDAMSAEIVRLITKMPERSLLYKSVALSIARAWPANTMPSIRAAFQALSKSSAGRLTTKQVGEFLESIGVEQRCASNAADAMDLDRDGSVDWTEFVAACTYLGSADFEKYLWEMFTEADSDDDDLLSQRDLEKLLPLTHSGNMTQDLFHDLTGRRDVGARIDWPTFRRHFQSKNYDEQSSNEEPPDAAGQQLRTDAAVPAKQDMAGRLGTAAAVAGPCLKQAFDFVEKVCQGLGPPLGNGKTQNQPPVADEPPPKVLDSDLQRLTDMGFTDKERCLAALQLNQNKLGDIVFEELCKSK